MNSMTIDGVQRNAFMMNPAVRRFHARFESLALARKKPSTSPTIIVPKRISNVTKRYGSNVGMHSIIFAG